jgi:RNA polymerase sigma-70 factor (ECF subfamily)
MRPGDPFTSPERLIRRVYSYVAYRIGDGPEAEDVTSDAIERAFRYRASYDSSLGSATAWVIGIARRCVAEALAAPRASGAQTPDVPSDLDLEEQTGRRLLLSAAMARLDPSDQELIALRYGADLTARQIAEQLDMNVNAVEVALHRARTRLRGFLDELESRPEPRPTLLEQPQPARNS